MYEKFYGLSSRPFTMLPDPYFLFWGHNHSLAYSMLEYGILNQAAFTVITGEIGSGKTTLLRQLLHSVGEHVSVGLVSNTMMGQGTLLEWVLLSLNQPFDHAKYVALLRQFQDFLISEYERGRHTIVIIDEAQNLDLNALEELRMLSNINSDGAQLLQIILVGQPQLRVMLRRPELVQFAQRITSDFHLGPLTAEEGAQYIHHRLSLVGAREHLFSKGAAEMVAEASSGIPRVINAVCDAALVYGYALHANKITVHIIGEVLGDRNKFGLIPLHPARGPKLVKHSTAAKK
ncbi:MAG TPA: AAA family ATPase [Aestuariivirga sp.]|nr:AAA family ATPase [Aestuariivirga sp.]